MLIKYVKVAMMYNVPKIFKLNRDPELVMLVSEYILLIKFLQSYKQT